MPKQVENCILCNETSDRFRPFEVVKGWRYVSCATCGFVFLNPQPTDQELTRFYNQSYRYDLELYKDTIPRQHIWLDMLEQFCGRPGDLLEVGCSYGYFLAAAKKRGWSVRGIELGEGAASFARKELGLPVDNGRILDVRNGPPSSFDAIVAWHVLEHDPVPHRFIEIAYELLRPGGVLALRVPNLNSTVAKLSGPWWQWLSPPEHICMYTLETLSRLLEHSNFKILASRTARGNARNMWFEILRARTKMLVRPNRNGHGEQFTFDPSAVYYDRVWYRASEALVTLGALPVDWLFTRWMSTHGREAELAVFARKPDSCTDAQSTQRVQPEG
jgi:SAM-dependent methyltransferase